MRQEVLDLLFGPQRVRLGAERNRDGDGREQTILDVPKFDFNWQIQYELAEPLHIPAGSKILGIGKYDNSPKNRWNPAPNLPVYWSEQSWDEMYQPFTEYSVDSQMLGEMTVTKSPQRD